MCLYSTIQLLIVREITEISVTQVSRKVAWEQAPQWGTKAKKKRRANRALVPGTGKVFFDSFFGYFRACKCCRRNFKKLISNVKLASDNEPSFFGFMISVGNDVDHLSFEACFFWGGGVPPPNVIRVKCEKGTEERVFFLLLLFALSPYLNA